MKSVDFNMLMPTGYYRERQTMQEQQAAMHGMGRHFKP